MSKTHKISVSLICIFLLFAIIFGIITRFSYKDIDYNELEPNISPEYTHQIIDRLSTENVIHTAETMEAAFVVTVKESEMAHEITKTTVLVNKVIKGEAELENKEIVIYEPALIQYKDDSYTQLVLSRLGCSNIMQEGKQYLVFSDKVNYDKRYEKTLDMPEYIVNADKITLYAFPITKTKAEPLPSADPITYHDAADYEYFCYTAEDAEKLTKIKNAVLEHYLD